MFRKVSGNVVKRLLSSKKQNHDTVTANLMPTPEGDFFELHKQRNFKHDSILALGIVLLPSAVYMFAVSKINLNLTPPETYEKEMEKEN